MEEEKETKNLSVLDHQMSRRSLVQVLLGGAIYGSTGTPCFGARLRQESGQPPDVGSIYDHVMSIADDAGYPLSYLSGDYPSTDAYRRMVKETTFELFHYNPPGRIGRKAGGYLFKSRCRRPISGRILRSTAHLQRGYAGGCL